MIPENILEIISWNDLCSWLEKNKNEEIGDDPSACWVFVKYFIDITDFHPTSFLEKTTPDKLEEGWYICNLEHDDEFYDFILNIRGDKVMILQTYGGREGIQIIHKSKEDFIREFKMAENGDSVSLEILIDLTPGTLKGRKICNLAFSYYKIE